jgi:multicomponent Na+:H+ antiporter subunit E
MSYFTRVYNHLLWLLILFFIWFILTEGKTDTASLLFGAVSVGVSYWFYLHLPQNRRFSVSFLGLLLFLGYFFKASLQGSWDVARRALHPDLPIRPGWCRYQPCLADGMPRWLFMSVISLLPGTLSADYDETNNVLFVHVLTQHHDSEQELHLLEQYLLKVFPDAHQQEKM